MSTPLQRFLVTAGNTRERIDAVRDWGNIFSGRTGFAIAKSLAAIGEVDFLSSNRAHLAEAAAWGAEHPIHVSSFESHKQLRNALSALMAGSTYDAVFMTAAVSDYKPQEVFAVIDRQSNPLDPSTETWTVRSVQAAKVKSTHGAIAVLGNPTEKLVDLFRGEWAHRGLLVKFKLEVGITREALLKVGEASRIASDADFLVANTLDMVDGAEAGAYLLSPGASEWIARPALPARMAALARNRR